MSEKNSNTVENTNEITATETKKKVGRPRKSDSVQQTPKNDVNKKNENNIFRY